jgi:hypothetical protein
MGTKEVTDLIGPPTDTHRYITGMAFVPYYYGSSATRDEWHYKGMGRITFSGGGPFGQRGSVEWVEYDPNEVGYYRSD